MQHKSLINKWISVLTLAVIFLLWHLETHYNWVNNMLIPKPETVWEAFLEVRKPKEYGLSYYTIEDWNEVQYEKK